MSEEKGNDEYKKILLAGIDGFEPTYADRFSHPFWEKIKDDSAIASIPCPEDIETGETATASSPRLWSCLNTGVGNKKNHVLGFWERINPETGEPERANVSMEWVRETKCEKIVNREHLGVEPYWTVLMEQGLSVGMTTVWFSYPIQPYEKELIDQTDSWILTDFQFPREDQTFEDNVRPTQADPKDDFLDQVGAGCRIQVMAQRDPRGLVEKMRQQDVDRYEHAQRCMEEINHPDVVGLYLRGVDGIHHARNNQEIASVEDIKAVYDANLNHIQEMWETGDFDYLFICSDHGSDCIEGDEAHSWPATILIYGEDVPPTKSLEAKYEDLVPTVIDFAGGEVPDWMEGNSLKVQVFMEERLKDLGYLPE